MSKLQRDAKPDHPADNRKGGENVYMAMLGFLLEVLFYYLLAMGKGPRPLTVAVITFVVMMLAIATVIARTAM